MLKIDSELCKKCGICVEACVKRVFKKIEDVIHVRPDNGCIECGQCIATCPHGAISNDEWDMEDFYPVVPPNISADDMMDFLKTKRSVRNFEARPIDHETIEKIIDAGRFAPSDKNTQRRGYIVVTDRETIEQMDRAVVESFRKLLKIVSAPVRRILGVSVPVVRELDKSVPGIKRLIAASDNGAHPVFYNAPCVIFTYGPASSPLARDTAVATQHYMMLAAQAMGISSCIIGYASTRPKAFNKIFHIPEGNVLQTATIFGYSSVKYLKLVSRKTPEVTWMDS